MKKLLTVLTALSLSAFVFAAGDENETTAVENSESTVSASKTEGAAVESDEEDSDEDEDEESGKKKKKRTPYVSPAEFGRIFFSNKLYEDDIMMSNLKEDSGFDEDSFPEKDFPAIKDEMSIGIKSERLNAALTVGAYVDDLCAYNDKSLGLSNDPEKHFGISGYIDDWYINFAPIPELAVALHESSFLDAAYLPIYNDSLEAGNIGSTGFTLIYRPHYMLKNLRITASIPFYLKDTDEYHGTFNKYSRVNWFNGQKDPDEEDSKYEQRRFNFNFGACYDNEFLQFGVSVKNIIGEDNLFGAYITSKNVFGHLTNFNINLGVAFSKNVVTSLCDLSSFGGLNGTKMFTGSATYSAKIVDLATEFAWNGFGIGEDANPAHKDFVITDKRIDSSRMVWDYWDLYIATSAKFKISTWFGIDIGARFLLDTTDEYNFNPVDESYEKAPFVVGGFLSFAFKAKRHSFGIGADVDFCDGNLAIKAPVYWKYSY